MVVIILEVVVANGTTEVILEVVLEVRCREVMGSAEVAGEVVISFECAPRDSARPAETRVMTSIMNYVLSIIID